MRRKLELLLHIILDAFIVCILYVTFSAVHLLLETKDSVGVAGMPFVIALEIVHDFTPFLLLVAFVSLLVRDLISFLRKEGTA